jgi:hypothetical protein
MHGLKRRTSAKGRRAAIPLTQPLPPHRRNPPAATKKRMQRPAADPSGPAPPLPLFTTGVPVQKKTGANYETNRPYTCNSSDRHVPGPTPHHRHGHCSLAPHTQMMQTHHNTTFDSVLMIGIDFGQINRTTKELTVPYDNSQLTEI